MAKPNPNPKTDPPTTKLTTSVSAFSGVAQQVTVSFPSITSASAYSGMAQQAAISFPSISVTTEVKT